METRGLWKMEHDAMGGPFVSHSRVDTLNNRVVVAEGFVYAPEKMKRGLIRRLEAALYTLCLPGEQARELKASIPEVSVVAGKRTRIKSETKDMKNGKILVGITHGDINGVGYEIILKLFSEPMMLELCTPIIYGSPKVATYHRKAMELTTNFVTIQKADEAVEGRLNLVDCLTDEVKIDFGQPSAEAVRRLWRLWKGLWRIIARGCSTYW